MITVVAMITVFLAFMLPLLLAQNINIGFRSQFHNEHIAFHPFPNHAKVFQKEYKAGPLLSESYEIAS